MLCIYVIINGGVMNKPKLHLLGIPHTQTTYEYSHCAFTGKVKRFAPMMQSVGYDVIHYGIEGGDSGASQQIDVLSVNEWNEIRHKLLYDKYKRHLSPADFVGDLANVGNDLYRIFNERLRDILSVTVQDRDIICLPFGHAHHAALVNTPQFKVETGIGYPDSFERFRVFESYAWYHYIMGKQNTSGNDYHWVIPNYYAVDEWDFNPTPERKLIYFGRLGDIKGLQIVVEIAKARPDLPVVICGQGDPTPYMQSPNIQYHPPIHGRERSAFLGSAMAVIMPTRYVEPFGGVTVEAQMTGTPVLGSTYGSFTETIQHGFNGYRCATLGDYLEGIKQIENGALDREQISDYNKMKYDMFNLAHNYDSAFKQIHDLYDKGWYTQHSHWVK